ncbi:MAG TPA: glycosyltransferase family 9 protein, partial [Verrucomicrobiae bacterium]|nr:glycosyltransferase family 9 protein [Verrucomicrobiae bacterium]
MRKLLLKCGLSAGDIVMLTAAVRDLHRCHPGRFVTDVRTPFPELWENNPFLASLSEEDPGVEQIDCSYPLINQCNDTPYHCLHGFIEFFNDRLGLAIKPAAFKGDIHLSEQEKAWYSQVHEVTGEDTPFWILAAGGKYDVTLKWWQSERYQEVVNHFRGKIQFVQVGGHGHHHPKLDGVIDLRGQTSFRELVRLVYHAQGVLCPITALMHLAAAVETKPGRPSNRACVVIAGGREPAHWEAYPGHQFIHTNGALACCANGGCWKDRTVPLRDGDQRDRPGHLCVNVINGLARCLDLITPAEVICRIETYFRGGALQYLSSHEKAEAEQGVLATARNAYDQQPLNLHSAGMACERAVQAIPAYPDRYQGRGIVICGGGTRYFTNAWVCINMLRRLGCRLPIQLWHLGAKELDGRMRGLVEGMDVECVDACRMRRRFPVRRLNGWELKPYAILHSRFREVLLLDADNVPVLNPGYLFDTPQFQSTGAIFWPDYTHDKNKLAAAIWRSCGLREPREPEFETGQIVVDKKRCWPALWLTLWFNENSDFYYRYLHGDKETFHLAFRKMKQSYSLVQKPIRQLEGTMCQHDFRGRRIFQHRNTNKWDLFLCNRRVKGFRFETECRAYVEQLRRAWNGGGAPALENRFKNPRLQKKTRPIRIEAVMISCAERNEMRRKTLANLARTDWGNAPLHLQIDDGTGTDYEKRQTHCAYLALKKSLDREADYVLFLEDDLDFNRHIHHN